MWNRMKLKKCFWTPAGYWETKKMQGRWGKIAKKKTGKIPGKRAKKTVEWKVFLFLLARGEKNRRRGKKMRKSLETSGWSNGGEEDS